jgi:hypothetical protein
MLINSGAAIKGADVNPGDADVIEAVLSAMGCGYTPVEPDDLPAIASADSDIKILFVEGCPAFFQMDYPGNTGMIASLLAFVGRGGHLFITGKADFLIDTLGLGYGVSMYEPSRPAEEFTGSANVAMDIYGNMRAYLQTMSVTFFPCHQKIPFRHEPRIFERDRQRDCVDGVLRIPIH